MLQKTPSQNLPKLPESGSTLSADDVAAIRTEVSKIAPYIDDMNAALEWLSKAAGFEAYLRARNLHQPMLGAMRLLEARVGQLLGPSKVGDNQHTKGALHHDVKLAHQDRSDFRITARALSGEALLKDEEWNRSRRGLIALVRKRLGIDSKYDPIIKSTDNWNFSPVRYGRLDDNDKHGYIPGDIYANCLWYWTKAGDVVAAPMAGSGQIKHVYDARNDWAKPEPWNLDLRMFDLNPRGRYADLIKHNDLSKTLPLKHADYIILDVPYFGMVKGQYSDKETDLANMDQVQWAAAIRQIGKVCAASQNVGKLCTVVAPNYRDLKTRKTFLATEVVRKAFVAAGYILHDLAYASRRIQQSQGAAMASNNNLARANRTMMTDISEILTFRKVKTK